MPTFGTQVVMAAWPVLQTAGALTPVILTTHVTSVDYETGAITTTDVVETPEALVSPFRPDEVDGLRVGVADRKVLVPTPALQTPPGLTTTVTMASEVWEMQAPPERVSNDGLWQLHVRRIGGA